MKLELQKILFPRPDICMAEPLYYHGSEKCVLNVPESVLNFDRDGSSSFDTYFNSFSIGKWRKYTILNNLKLELELSGTFAVSIVNYELINGAIVGKVIDEQTVSAEERSKFVFSFAGFHQNGMHSFILLAREDGSAFYGGSYFTDEIEVDQLQNVKIALNMCTYMREKYITKNVAQIRTALIENPDSPLYQNMHVYITDNAMTLRDEDFSGPYIHLTRQNAFGSVGGFTRGLINILDARIEYGLTHALMLDDDIVLDPQVLCRTYTLLRMMKPEYREAWLGGGMLGLDFPTVQTESGGVIENGEYRSLKVSTILENPYQVLYNEIEEGAKMNAWWFCGIPLASIGTDALPYPVYFHCDDMEYACRQCKKLILINGICVWHEEFFYKPDTYYYDKRNREVLFALHFPKDATKKRAKRRLLKDVVNELLWYRYHDAQEILDGVSDFLKGPDWLTHTDDRAKFDSVRKSRIPTVSVSELPLPFDYDQYLASLSYPGESKARRWFRRLTLNGWLLPANRDVIVRAETPITYHFFRAKRVMNYSAKNHCAYMSRKSFQSAFRILLSLVKTLWRIDRRYDSARDEYRHSIEALTTQTFWQKHYATRQGENA